VLVPLSFCCLPQSGAVYLEGSASFQECSFSGNTALSGSVSFLSFQIILLISVCHSLSLFVISTTHQPFYCCSSFLTLVDFVDLFLFLLVSLFFVLFSFSQGGAVFIYGSASFQTCSFDGNTATGDVSSLSFVFVYRVFDLLSLTFFLSLCSSSSPPTLQKQNTRC